MFTGQHEMWETLFEVVGTVAGVGLALWLLYLAAIFGDRWFHHPRSH